MDSISIVTVAIVMCWIAGILVGMVMGVVFGFRIGREDQQPHHLVFVEGDHCHEGVEEDTDNLDVHKTPENLP